MLGFRKWLGMVHPNHEQEGVGNNMNPKRRASFASEPLPAAQDSTSYKN